jgi:hypothetical protein
VSKFYFEGNALRVCGKLEPKTVQEAVELSIQKWEAIVQKQKGQSGKEISGTGCFSCGLCHMFMGSDGTCDGCLVYRTTGKICCHDTPYTDFEKSYSVEDAQREVEFLKGLRDLAVAIDKRLEL